MFAVLEETAARYGKRPALHQPCGNRTYQSLTWTEYKQAVVEVACGLRTLGIKKGDVVALDSETRAEFYLADQGIMANGSIAAALYTSYPVAERLRILRACNARAVIVENPEALKTLREGRAESLQVPWILLTGESPGAMSLQQLRAWGRQALHLFDSIRAEYGPDDYAILYLTSGATGEPKMGLVTHAAITANLEMGVQILDLGPDDVTIAFLPSAHITQRMVLELLPIRMGCPVWFSAGLSRLPAEMRELRPTWFLAPPRVWERIHATIRSEIQKRPAPVRKLIYGALGLGEQAARWKQEGKPLPGWMVRSLRLADVLVFQKIRSRFGGRIRLAVSGSAPLGAKLARFYRAIGLPLVEGYGLTEGGIVSVNPVHRPKAGSIGVPLPGVAVRVAEDGELLVKSPAMFAGYLNDPAATQAVLRDGWLHTGDIAEIDAEGYLFITGRKKEVLVSSSGRKIYPSRIECLLKSEPLISQVLLIGDRMPYITALLTVNLEAAAGLKGLDKLRAASPAEIIRSAPVQRELREAIRRVNEKLAGFEQIRKFRVLEQDFSMERGELTPTLKVRRQPTLNNYQSLIQEMYSGKGEWSKP